MQVKFQNRKFRIFWKFCLQLKICLRICLRRLHISDLLDSWNSRKSRRSNDRNQNRKSRSKKITSRLRWWKEDKRNKELFKEEMQKPEKNQQKDKRTQEKEEDWGTRKKEESEERKDAEDSRKRREGKMKKEGGLLYESFRRKPGWRFTAGST